jgi:hypothetical protein
MCIPGRFIVISKKTDPRPSAGEDFEVRSAEDYEALRHTIVDEAETYNCADGLVEFTTCGAAAWMRLRKNSSQQKTRRNKPICGYAAGLLAILLANMVES